MKIEIKLKDPRKCDGCPMLVGSALYQSVCRMTGKDIGWEEYDFKKNAARTSRPQECVRRWGE